MKSLPSIACLTCWLVPVAVDSFATTTTRLRIPQTATRAASSTNHPRRINSRHRQTSLAAYGNYGGGRSSPRYARQSDRTKRQERVGHVVRSELASLLHRDLPVRGDDDPIDPDLRRRISVVHVDVSPDLRQARVTVSVVGGRDRRDDAAAKRRAYAWLVRNTKGIRYTLAKKMRHMKGGSPDLTFAQVDVGAAVDVMHLIEKVSEGYKREDVMDFEDGWDDDGTEGDDDDDGWFDFDEEGDGVSVEVEV